MKKVLLTSLFLTAAISAFSFDFGGSVTNKTKIANLPNSDGVYKLDQKNTASAWFKTPFGSSTTDYFLLQGTYLFNTVPAEEKTINAINLDLCKAVYVEDEFTITAGRFPMSDLSGIVYCQIADGGMISYDSPVFRASGYGFYTGFLNSQFISIIDDDFKADSEKLYDFGPAYVVSGAKASLPYFLGEQTISAEGIFTAKLESDAKAHTRVYAEGSLEGPLFINGLYYNLTGVLGFEKIGSGDFSMGNLSKGTLSYYGDYYGMCISANSTYASGNQGGFDRFTGFTSCTAVTSLLEPEWSGIFVNGLSVSCKPVSSILLSAGADVVIDAASSLEYAGFQYGAGLDWQIFSDVLAGAEITQYFASEDSDTYNKTAITIKAVVTF